jgi:hypothetical protein
VAQFLVMKTTLVFFPIKNTISKKNNSGMFGPENKNNNNKYYITI